MSLDISVAALDSSLPVFERFAMFLIGDNANCDGSCSPTPEKLSDWMGIPADKAKEVIGRLVAKGLLIPRESTEKPKSVGGAYLVDLGRLRALARVAEVRHVG